LFSLLGRGTPVALFGTATPALAASFAALGIEIGTLSEPARRIYGTRTRSDVWLVRPDGYIAHRGAATDAKTFRVVLRRLYDRKLVDSAFAAQPPSDATPAPPVAGASDLPRGLDA
jgi:hypothetical protein